MAALSSSGAAVNGNFESGSFTGWHLDVPRDRASLRAVGTANPMQGWSPQPDTAALVTPFAGEFFFSLGTLADGNLRDRRHYNITLQQRLWLNAGDTVSGWSAFFNGDYQGQDSAWVRIFNGTGSQIAMPWQERSGSLPSRDFNSVPFLANTDWTPWQWSAPQEGEFTIILGMSTSGDDNLASYGFFDNIFVSPAQISVVPEPSALALVGLGGVLLWRRARKQTFNSEK